LVPAKLGGKLAMAKPFGDDLRRELLQAYDRGEGTLQQLAERFAVSVAWAWKISAQRKRSGQMERAEQRRGGGRKVTDEVKQRLSWGLWNNPDLTLAGLQELVADFCDLHVSIGRLSQVLHQMGLRLKRSHSTAANATPKRISSSNKPSRKRSARSRRRG
jgi:transposase